jgi:carbon monoxide dehydrogenase subunit G
MPGANVKVKVGAMAMTYRGPLRIVEQDDTELRP